MPPGGPRLAELPLKVLALHGQLAFPKNPQL